MKNLKLLLPLFCFTLLLVPGKANNLQITNVSVNQTTQTVSFTVSWENGWRVSTAPYNWDAVWLFVKFRACSAAAGTAFTSGILSSSTSAHTHTFAEAMTSVNWNGTTGIKESGVQGATMDYTDGIMLRRNSLGNGYFASDVTLKITNLPAAGTDITTNVYGLEMVYVPKGDFYIGDGINTGSAFRFGTTTVTTTAAPVLVDSTYETSTKTFTTIGGVGGGAVPAAWPKGNCGFYLMKYEITEGAYAEFLNSITAAAAAARFPSPSFNSNRDMLWGTAQPYSPLRPDRAQNHLSWTDVGAFLDWACLRPITETEFEKAARGTLTPIANEYAWGSIGLSAATAFTSGENGTEGFTGGWCVVNNVTYTTGDGGLGPVKVGIFATNASSRVSAGASYYGAMEMSGNVAEWVSGLDIVTAAHDSLKRVWGDGNVDAVTGQHNALTWPAGLTVMGNGSYGNTIGLKGGYFGAVIGSTTNVLQISDRSFVFDSSLPVNNSRSSFLGGRGGR